MDESRSGMLGNFRRLPVTFILLLVVHSALALALMKAIAPVCFFAGAGIHFWVQIDGIVRSSKRPEITSIGGYVLFYKAQVVARLFVSVMLFLVVYFGGESVGLALPETTNPWVKVGLIGFCGLGIDRLMVELQQRFGLVKGAIPELPEATNDDKSNGAAGGQ
jgi:hypothetical protein